MKKLLDWIKKKSVLFAMDLKVGEWKNASCVLVWFMQDVQKNLSLCVIHVKIVNILKAY